MRQERLDSNTVAQLDERCLKLQVKNDLSIEETANLSRHAGKLLEARIYVRISLHDLLTGPDTCGMGMAPLLNAIIDQACMDAARELGLRSLVLPA